jgi:hypothetical protein
VHEVPSARVRAALASVLLLALASGPALAAPGAPAPLPAGVVLDTCLVGPDVLCVLEGGCVAVVLGLQLVCMALPLP